MEECWHIKELEMVKLRAKKVTGNLVPDVETNLEARHESTTVINIAERGQVG